jgi:hypothetical protein
LLNHVLATPKRLSDFAVSRDAPGLSDLVAAMLAKAPGERPSAQGAYEALTAELARYEAANPHAPGRLVVEAARRGEGRAGGEEGEEAPVVEERREPAEGGGRRGQGGRSGSGPNAAPASVPPAVSAEVLRYVTAPLPEGFRGPAEPLPFVAVRDAREGTGLAQGATEPAPRWLRTERMAPVQPTGAVPPERPATMAVHGTAPWPTPAPAATTAPAATPAAEESPAGALPVPAGHAVEALPVSVAPAAARAAEREGAGAPAPPPRAAVVARAIATHEEALADCATRGTLALRMVALAAMLAAVAGVSFAIGRSPASLRGGAEAPVVASSGAAAVTGAPGAAATTASPGSSALPDSRPALALSSPVPSPSVPAPPHAMAERAAPEVDAGLPRSAPDLASPAAAVRPGVSAPSERRTPRRAGRTVDDPGFYERVVEEEVYGSAPMKGPPPSARPIPAPAGGSPARRAPRGVPPSAPHRHLH